MPRYHENQQISDLIAIAGHWSETVTGVFHTSEDRAAAVLVRSYLETLLERALRVIMKPGKPTDELLQRTGPLATFSARTSLAYAVGLISEATFQDLTYIRKIGNHFAHNIGSASFSDQSPRDLAKNLAAVREIPEADSPRTAFLLAAALAGMAIYNSARAAADPTGAGT